VAFVWSERNLIYEGKADTHEVGFYDLSTYCPIKKKSNTIPSIVFLKNTAVEKGI